MKKLLLILIPILIFGFALYIAVSILFFHEEGDEETILKTIVVKQDITQIVRGSGIVISHEQVDIIARLSGEIHDFNIKVGDLIEKDKVLFTIENYDIENEYNLAKAEYEKAKVELDELKASPDHARVLEAKNAFTKAEVAYKEMQNTIELKKRLFKEGFVSRKEYDDLSNKLEFSKNEFELAKNRFDEVSEPPSDEEIDLSEAKLHKLKIKLDDIQEKVEGRKVTSPVSGTVVDIKIDESLLERGEEIPPGTSVMMVANLKENLFVNGEIYESDISKINVGQEVMIFFSQQSRPYRGKITEISLVAKSYGTIRKFPIEIEIITDVSGFVKLGMRVNFEIIVAEKKQILTLPLTYVQTVPYGKKVLVKKDDTIIYIPIKTGIYNDQFIEIISGLGEGQEVFLKRLGAEKAPSKRKRHGRRGVSYRKI